MPPKTQDKKNRGGPGGQSGQQMYVTVKERRPAKPEERAQTIIEGFSSIERFRYSDLLNIVNNFSAEITAYAAGAAGRLAVSAQARNNKKTAIDELKVGGPGHGQNTPNFIDALSPNESFLNDKQVNTLVINGVINPDDEDDRKLFYTSVKNILRYGVGELEDAGSDASIRGVLDQKINKSRRISSARIPATPADINEFKTVSEIFQTTATKLERIERAIMATADTFDYADGYEFYANIENLYTQKFEIQSLIDDVKDSIQTKLMTGGDDLEDFKETATREKAEEVTEDYNKKLQKLQNQRDKLDQEIAVWNGKLAGAIGLDERRLADKRLMDLFTETQKNIETVQNVSDELISSRTGNWFDFVETKTDNFVDIVGVLFKTRKERVESERKQKEATAKFLAGVKIQKNIEDCLKDMKTISTSKCDRINQLRELHRRAKEIEEKKSDIVQNAALMLNPSRGIAKYNDDMTNAQRIRRFEELHRSIDTTYRKISTMYPTAPAQATETHFRREFVELSRLFDAVETSAAMYGDNPNSVDNQDLVEFKAKNKEFNDSYKLIDATAAAAPVAPAVAAPPQQIRPNTPIPINDLYDVHFVANNARALRILEKQITLLKLSEGGGELVRQQIDGKMRQTNNETVTLMDDYQTLKSLPSEIEKTEESVKKCFNEGFDRSKKQIEDALRKDLDGFKMDYESELKYVEKEYKDNLLKAKNEVKENRDRPPVKNYKDMSPEELETEYQRLLAEVQRIDNRLKENRPEDASKIGQFRGQLDAVRNKLKEIGQIRKVVAPPAGGSRYHRTIRRIR